MILFKKDWLKYPTAIVDYQTRNQSFVELAMLLRDMGVENHLFPLALINPALQGIDPHSEDLTEKQIAMIMAESKINPWYFLREVLRAPARSGTEPNPVRGNRSNIALWWCFLNHIMIFLVQPRQTGKSFNTDGIMVWLLCITCVNTAINLLTKDDTLRRENIERIKGIIHDLPSYMSLRDKADANNGEEITIKALGNTYKTHVPQMSPKRANNLGRGLTTAVMHIDEPPFQPNIDIALPAALASMSAAVDEAKKNHAPYGIIFTTTAGRKDEKEGLYIYNMVMGAAPWNEKLFLDAEDHEDLRRRVRETSPDGLERVYAVFSHNQLGFDDDWLREVLETVVGNDAKDVVKANMDYFNIWSSGTESSPFDPEIARAISLNKREADAKKIEDIGNLVTKWYIPRESIESYMLHKKTILGLDTSDAVGKDDIGFVLTDVETLNVVATGKFNHINLFEFSRFIANWLHKYQNVTAVIERRSSGTYILDYLLVILPELGENPFKRIFNRVVQEAATYPDRFNEIRGRGSNDPKVIERYKQFFGYPTSGSGSYTRDILYGNNFQVALEKGHDRLHDIDLSDQLLKLTVKNGRIDHNTGEHDDMVIAWLLTNWLLTNGKELHYYGIDSSSIYQAGHLAKKELTYEEVVEMEEQNNIRQRMIKLYDELENEENDYVTMKIEQELRLLNKKLILRENEIFSIDQLIKAAYEKKKRKRQESRMMDTIADYQNQYYQNRYYRY